MILLQASDSSTGVSTILFFGTLGMFVVAILIIVFVAVHQRQVIKDLFKKIALLVNRVKELEAQLPGNSKPNES